MSSVIQNDPGSKLTSGCALLGLLAIAFVLAIIAHEVIDVIDEGIMHEMTRFESEPKEGWDYWRWKAIREALPSWIVAGSIWLSAFGFVLWRAWKRVTHILN
jgi:hypothetical protein